MMSSKVKASHRWFEDEGLWAAKRSVIFNRNMVRFTFFETSSIIKLAGLKGGEAVLDLCCGIGRHTLDFAKRGFPSTGVDITKSYIDTAKENAATQNISIEYVHDDIRNFCRPTQYDLVINMFTSFGYFENKNDDALVLRHCFTSLRNNGKMIIEVLSKEIVARDFREKYTIQSDGYEVLVEQKISEDLNMLQVRWTIMKELSSEVVLFSVRLYSAKELSELLKECGFAKIDTYGNLNGSLYDDKAKNLVIVGQK